VVKTRFIIVKTRFIKDDERKREREKKREKERGGKERERKTGIRNNRHEIEFAVVAS